MLRKTDLGTKASSLYVREIALVIKSTIVELQCDRGREQNKQQCGAKPTLSHTWSTVTGNIEFFTTYGLIYDLRSCLVDLEKSS